MSTCIISVPRRAATLASAIGLSVVLSACGSSATTQTAAGGGTTAPGATASGGGVATTHNAVDVTFINGMTPHHSGAIAMAQLAPTRAGNQQVKDLAARIAGAQTPEQQRMAAMAAAWGVPAPSTDAAGGMGGSSASAAPMGDDDTSALTPLSGAVFDREFLTRMTDHHKSALPMAKAELDGGTNPQARELAQQITDTQTREIAEMAALLKTV